MSAMIRLSLVAVLFAGPAWSQQTTTPSYTADEAASLAEMRTLQDEIGSGKRAFIEEQLVLTPKEATRFWPIYDAHQKALSAFNQRRLDNILSYARHYNANSLNDAAATAIAEEALALERDEAMRMEQTYRQLIKAVPPVKAVRYLQVENKVRAIVRFEQAAQVPFVR